MQEIASCQSVGEILTAHWFVSSLNPDSELREISTATVVFVPKPDIYGTNGICPRMFKSLDSAEVGPYFFALEYSAVKAKCSWPSGPAMNIWKVNASSDFSTVVVRNFP